ncbi:hypothetical protein QBZ16_000810 [Prototheca wickerhamii]|uniref:Uncharacterized protein n=1 Tax=Prototheca wickerhamii TaxID=3111 RepID=A0AAD9MPD4_PROWI|nr:hypothetical protein QBZ16_000810 [Prototheca wickerhamii]
MASATPPRRRQLTIVEACTSPRAATAYEKETSQPLIDPQKLQEFRNIEESYIQAWIKESTRLARSAAPTVQASRRVKRESEPSQTQESVADALDSIAGRYLDACERTALDHLVLILRCDGLHTSRQLACRSLEVLTGVLDSWPPAVRAAGPNNSSVLEWNEQGVWTPLGAEPSSLTWKTLLSSDMAAAGAAEGTGDRNRAGGHRLPSSLALLLHLLEGASQPTSRQRPQGDVMLLQYLVRVLRRDLEARVQVYDSIPPASAGGAASPLQGRRVAVLQHSLLARIYCDLMQPLAKEKRAEFVRQLVLSIGALAQPDAAQPDALLSRAEVAALAATLLRMLLELFGRLEAAGVYNRLSRGRAGAAVNFRMELDQRVISCLLGPDTSGPEGLAAVLEAQGPQDRFRCINLLLAAQYKRAGSVVWQADKIDATQRELLAAAAELLEHGTEVEGSLAFSPEAGLAFIEAVISQPNLRSLRDLGALATLVGALSGAVAQDAALRREFGGRLAEPVQRVCHAIAKSLAGERRPSREAVGPLLHAQSLVAELSS